MFMNTKIFPFFSFKCSFACIILKRAQQVTKQNQRPQTTVEKNVFLFIWKARQPAYVVVRAEVQDLKQCQG